ncbi:MAG: translation initiation factor IF-6 [Candidatus Aenigmatarchaeota archaeon]
MKFLKTSFYGDPNIGLYGFSTDKYCLLGLEPSKKILKKIKHTLNVKIKIIKIAGTELVGIFSTGNKNGILLPKIIEKQEIRNLKKLDLNFEIINSRKTALGNLILCNDYGCLISKNLKKFKKQIKDVLNCEIVTGTIAGLEIVGSTAIANNKGCLCHMNSKKDEIRKIEELLNVKVDIGTVNYGSPFVKSGIIVNNKGIIFSEQTTGPELGRIDEVFK